VVGIVLSLVLAFVAVSFMTRRNWAYIAVMVVLGLYVVLGIIGTVARADIDTLSPVQIILMLISGFVVLYMLTNEELKQQYMEPK
jgi:carbon starvation protein CstA